MELSPQPAARLEGDALKPNHNMTSVRQPKWAVTCARFILRMSEVLDVHDSRRYLMHTNHLGRAPQGTKSSERHLPPVRFHGFCCLRIRNEVVWRAPDAAGRGDRTYSIKCLAQLCFGSDALFERSERTPAISSSILAKVV
jgi:hypothetical protein